MEISIRQVGKRWFQCLGDQEKPLVEVEASYSNGHEVRHSESLSAEAGYSVYDWIPTRLWTLTGKGARKYREQIIFCLEKQMEVSK